MLLGCNDRWIATEVEVVRTRRDSSGGNGHTEAVGDRGYNDVVGFERIEQSGGVRSIEGDGFRPTSCCGLPRSSHISVCNDNIVATAYEIPCGC
jgi:hypothetical protein